VRRHDVREKRKRLGFTLQEVEKAIGYPANTLSLIERGLVSLDETGFDRIDAVLCELAEQKEGERKCAESDERSLASSSLAT
jgi:transcriptional regulator with XRE-family HTH domain